MAEQGGELRAVGDLKQSLAERLAQASTSMNLLSRGHFCSTIGSLMAQSPTMQLAMAKPDRREAYKQLPLAPEPSEAYCNDPIKVAWSWFTPRFSSECPVLRERGRSAP